MTLALPPVALVTGAARRIGRAIALELAQAGFDIALHHHHSEREAEETVEAIRQTGVKAVMLSADLALESEVGALIDSAGRALGPVGILVNNASLFERDEILSVTRDSWDRHMEINLRAPFRLTQDFARQAPENARGAVINILDQRVWNLTPHFMSYTLSKAGLWTLTRTLALALAPRITVNAVGPGPTLPSARQSLEDFQRQCQTLPLGHGATPEEIAQTVRFLAQAPSITGQMLAADGGQHLGWRSASTGRDDVE